MPKILVLMSSYNGEKYIEQQIESIMNQTIADDITLRIRDDGSSDGTVNKIKQLQEKYRFLNKEKIELIIGKNIGYNASFFELINGINIAEGYSYYSLSDQDDIWLKSKLEYAVNSLSSENDEIPLLYASTSYLVNDDLKPYGQTRRKVRDFSIYNIAIQNICPGHTQVFNNSLLKLIKNNNIDVNRIYVYDSWITNYAIIYGKIVFNNSSYTYYRQHMNNQFGYGSGKLGQIYESMQRGKLGDGHKYRKQLAYLVECNENKLREIGACDELNTIVSAKMFMQRLKYAVKGRFYRQNKVETLIFYIGFIAGKY